LAALFLLFGAAGYFWLPGFAKQKAEALLAEEFGRPVRIDAIKISPYALSATISGFSVGQKGAQAAQNATDPELFGLDSLSIDLSAASLRGIPVVSEVRLTGPRLHLLRPRGRVTPLGRFDCLKQGAGERIVLVFFSNTGSKSRQQRCRAGRLERKRPGAFAPGLASR